MCLFDDIIQKLFNYIYHPNYATATSHLVAPSVPFSPCLVYIPFQMCQRHQQIGALSVWSAACQTIIDTVPCTAIDSASSLPWSQSIISRVYVTLFTLNTKHSVRQAS